ncbi:MAG: tRNA pseudouridine(55) synthase TruB [Alphaproteobacteria bacterium]|nr:tRNA pseudouridine(55) synthase TruB [Alphaproteobacteria bacterium]
MNVEGHRPHGWLVIDKPEGMTSSSVVGRVRRLTGTRPVGHAGTLDPLATGVLPVALGEATKTTSFAMTFTKSYRVTVAWGEERSTDDREGDVVAASGRRPTVEEVSAALPHFIGTLSQRPPAFSAIKVSGRRAYAIARSGGTPELADRTVVVYDLRLVSGDRNAVSLEVDCGKGFYVRALARDLGRSLGTLGYVQRLRRTRVGPFTESAAISLDSLGDLVHSARLIEVLQPLLTALDDIPALAVSDLDATKIRHGQRIMVSSPAVDGLVVVVHDGRPVALARSDHGSVAPVRVFNL